MPEDAKGPGDELLSAPMMEASTGSNGSDRDFEEEPLMLEVVVAIVLVVVVVGLSIDRSFASLNGDKSEDEAVE
jgi:hypothetical protein